MEIIVYSKSQPRREFIQAALNFYAQELGLERSRYRLQVFSRQGLVAQGSRGELCKLGPRSLVMFVDNRLGMNDLLVTLAHEMIHAKQYARGQLRSTYSRRGNAVHYWNGRRVRAEYYDRPWEQEAFARERLLANRVFQMI
jgi:hypothetical protein